MSTHQIELPQSTVKIDNRGFLYIRMQQKALEGEIDVLSALLSITAIKKLSEDGPMPLLIDTRGFKGSISTEARSLFIKSPTLKGIRIAEAFLVDSFSNRLQVNTYRRLSKPSRPTKIFSNPEEAIEWLGHYKS